MVELVSAGREACGAQRIPSTVRDPFELAGKGVAGGGQHTLQVLHRDVLVIWG